MIAGARCRGALISPLVFFAGDKPVLIGSLPRAVASASKGQSRRSPEWMCGMLLTGDAHDFRSSREEGAR